MPCDHLLLSLKKINTSFIYYNAKKTRKKNIWTRHKKWGPDEGAGHTTERGSKLSVPLQKIHNY